MTARDRSPGPWGGILGVLLVIVGGIGGVGEVGMALAAAGNGISGGAMRLENPDQEQLIRDIQRRLNEIGLYNGPIDGRDNNDLRRAIESYERQVDLPVSGRVTVALKEHLDDASAQAKRLLRRLEEARLRQIDEARAALDGNARSRALMARSEVSARFSDLDTAEQRRCLENPDEGCLVAEALDALVTVTDSEQRDWVLGRLVVLQALRGDQARSLGVMVRISDPRLVVQGLRNAALALALRGDLAGANEAAAAIPLPWRQAEAFLELAQVAGGNTDPADVVGLVDRALDRATWLKKAMDLVDLNCGSAKILHSLGQGDRALALVDKAETLVVQMSFPNLRDVGFHRISRARLNLGDLDGALAAAEKVHPESHLRDVALADIVAWLAGHQRWDEARRHLARMEDTARAATAGAELAGAMALAGANDQRQQLLNSAIVARDDLNNGMAADRLAMAIAIAAASAGEMALADRHIGALADREIGARAAWAVARSLSAAGNEKAAMLYRQRAETLAGNLANRFERAWVLAELALLAREGQGVDAARRLFSMAVAEARQNEVAWFKARALTRMAVVRLMIEADEAQFVTMRQLDGH